VERRFARRMLLFYGGYFVCGGIAVPFFPVWLQAQGLTAVEIASVTAIPTLIRVFLTPLAGLFADRAPNRRFATIALTIPAFFIFLLMWPARTYWPILLISGASFTLWALALPVAEALALTGVRRFGLDYGRMRLGGSVAYVITNVGAGTLIGLLHPEAIFWLVVLALALSVVVSFNLPVTPPAVRAADDAARPVAAPVGKVLRQPAFLALIVVGAIIQSSHAVLYSFGSIHWTALGFSGVEIGAFWAMGVCCEILVFTFSQRLVGIFGPYGLLVAGGLAAIVRWVGLAQNPGFIITALLSCLHGLTFGAVYVGNQHAIARTVPEKATASAQGLFAMVSAVLMAGTTGLAGVLYRGFNGEAFLFMIPLPVLALLILFVYRRLWPMP